MNSWEEYPSSYREREVQQVLRAVRAGECVSVLGLSGSGKSNLAGFLAHRMNHLHPFLLVDCNRLPEPSPTALLRLVRTQLGDSQPAGDEVSALETAVSRFLQNEPGKLCLIFDRFDALPDDSHQSLAGPLRALRDAYKYRLTYVLTSRRPLGMQNELSELFFANTFWLRPLSESDARWNVERYSARLDQHWPESILQKIIQSTWGYPSLLKAACQAYAASHSEDREDWRQHPAVEQRVREFWSDQPSLEQIEASGLKGHPWLASEAPVREDQETLTAKEHLLLAYFQQHANEICEKDQLILAVWPEDKVYSEGLRDDSLAQLIRRLRRKIEADASSPRHILTIPGRGYRYVP